MEGQRLFRRSSLVGHDHFEVIPVFIGDEQIQLDRAFVLLAVFASDKYKVVVLAPKTRICIVLPLIAASPTLHGHEGSANAPPPSTDNNRQAPRTGWRKVSHRQQPTHETAVPRHQSLSATCAQSIGTRSMPVWFLPIVSQCTPHSA